MMLRVLITYVLILLVLNQNPGISLEISEEKAHENTVTTFFNNQLVSYSLKERNQSLTLQNMFGESLYFIVVQLYNYFVSLVPTEDQVNKLLNESISNPYTNYVFSIRKDYVEDICLHIVRCLDYVYVNSSLNHEKILQMYKLNSVLCRQLKSIKNNCSIHNNPLNKIPNEESIICYSRGFYWFGEINDLKKITLEEFRINEKHKEHQDTERQFVSSEFQQMSKIDWQTFSMGLVDYDIFQQTSKSDVRSHNNQNLLKPLADAAELENKLINLSVQYTLQINENQCAPVPGCNGLFSVVRNLIIYSLQRLEQHFILLLKNSSSLDFSYFNNNVIGPIKNACDNLPEILLYLFEIDHINAIHSITFKLYLSLCGNNIDFIDIRCPAKDGSELESIKTYDVKCARKAILDKLLWLSYSRTGKVFIEDEYTTNSKTNTTCSQLNYSYIKNISIALTEFYQKKGSVIIVWTTYDWLSLKYLFTDNNKDFHIDKYKLINIESLPFTLKDIYNYFLPLNTNMRTFLAFQMITLCDNLDETLNMYVYQHAITINYFLGLSPTLIKSNKFRQILNQSIAWYQNYRNKLFLSPPFKCEMRRDVFKIINAITTFGVNSSSEDMINHIPEETRRKLDDEFRKNAQITAETKDWEGNMKLYLNENCLSAIRFVFKFISIIEKSTKIINNSDSKYDENIALKTCYQITGAKGNSSVNSLSNIPSIRH